MKQFLTNNNSDDILSGKLITEDFLDNVDGSDIVKAASEDGSLIPSEGPRVQVSIAVMQLSFSLKRRAEIIERILNNSPLFVNARVAACEIEDDTKEYETVEFVRSDIPSEKSYLVDGFLHGKFRPVSLRLIVNYDVAVDLVSNISFARFAKYVIQLSQDIGKYVNYHPDNITSFVLYNTERPDEYGQFTCTNGHFTEDDIADAYEALYQEKVDRETGIIRNIAMKTDFMSRVKASVDAYNKSEDVFKINVGELKTIDENHIVIPLEFYGKNVTEETQQKSSYFFMIIEKYVMRVIPDVVLKEKFICVSLRSDVKIKDIDNKTVHVQRAKGEDPSYNDNAINIAYRFYPILITKNGRRYESFRFADIMRMRDNTRLYVVVPLTNGFISKDPNALNCPNPSLEPFIKTKL